MNRDQLISWLTTNCECLKGADPSVLNGLPDDRLKAMKDQAERDIARQTVFNHLTSGVEVGGQTVRLDLETGSLVANEMTCPKCGAKMGDGECSCKKGGTMNSVQPDEWLRQTFPGLTADQVRTAVHNALLVDQREKAAVIDRLTANIADPKERRAMALNLDKKYDLKGLEELSRLLPTHNAGQPTPSYAPGSNPFIPDYSSPSYVPGGYFPQPNFAGAAGAMPMATNAAIEKDRDNLLPDIVPFSPEAGKDKQTA